MPGKFEFDEAFWALTGYEPFPWQARLFGQLSAGGLPPAVDIPTGLGKTSVMALWLLARAAGAELPCRLVYVVDRRAVVDQATDFAGQIRNALGCSELEQVRQGLEIGDRPLAISTLRGKHVDNREWLEDPAAPAIIVGTVDMIGSRLLFEGYGVSRRMRPYAAGLMGCDTLVMLDEAHLSRPFERLLRTIEAGQHVPTADGAGGARGCFTGPRSTAVCPPPFRVLPLSATLGNASGSERPFTLDDDDRANEIVRARLEASKTLTIEDLDKDAQLEDVLAERAWSLVPEEGEAATGSVRILIYCDRRKDAEKVAESLRKRAGKDAVVILFVGGRRVHEREMAACQLREHGLVANGNTGSGRPVFLVATSAGEVGVDLDADHMVCDLVAWERMVQRLGRVNRRGNGAARVLAIDQGPPDKKQAGEAGLARHAAVRKLLEALPRDGTGGHRASPAALVGIGENSEFQGRIDEASTRTPLYPALTRPLVDAWAMTSLAEHTGRPEVGPWLRGWVEDEQPQTTVVWRRFLPVRFDDTATGARISHQMDKEIEAFFEAAPLQSAELLEAETWRVVDWLKRRTRKLLKMLEKGAIGERAPIVDETGEDGNAVADAGELLPPLASDTPIAFLLDGNGRFEKTLNPEDVAGLKGKELDELKRRLAGQELVVDARLGGLKEGLLDDDHDGYVPTIEDNWGKSETWEEAALDEALERNLPAIRVRALRDGDHIRLMHERKERHQDLGRSPDLWQEVLAAPLRTSREGDVIAAWLVVEKQSGAMTDEEARAMAPVHQTLHEHQAHVASEAARIAATLNLAEKDRAMLVAAARHHDDGKEAARWQRAFNAPREGGPYAKTAGPVNRRVLNGYRHELQSMLDAQKDGLDGMDRSDPRFDLALHLIAAHHGNARPAIGIEGCDSLPPTAAARRAREVALRFARLQRQWGPWGLAWWESLLRAADQRASRALEEDARRALEKMSKEGPSATVPLATQLALFATGTKESE